MGVKFSWLAVFAAVFTERAVDGHPFYEVVASPVAAPIAVSTDDVLALAWEESEPSDAALAGVA